MKWMLRIAVLVTMLCAPCTLAAPPGFSAGDKPNVDRHA